jgi:hypothetical protein
MRLGLIADVHEISSNEDLRNILSDPTIAIMVCGHTTTRSGGTSSAARGRRRSGS